LVKLLVRFRKYIEALKGEAREEVVRMMKELEKKR